MDQPVAVKFLHASHAGDPTLVERFHAEARNSSRLRHPNSIRVFDFGQTRAGDLYMVMELLRGMSLGQALRGGSMSPGRVAHIGVQVAKALSEAHDTKLIHRDLKPENIFLVEMVGEPDFVKVLDYGIAKLLDTPGESLTETGMVIGTPVYMSPEQIQKGERPIDGRADLYALGVILYRMLAGKAPFSGTGVQLLMAHLTQPVPDLRALTKSTLWPVPERLCAIIMRLLEKDRDARFPNALSVAQALEPLVTATIPPTEMVAERTVKSPDIRRRRSRFWAVWASAAAVLVVGLAVLLVAFWPEGDKKRRKSRKRRVPVAAKPVRPAPPAPTANPLEANPSVVLPSGLVPTSPPRLAPAPSPAPEPKVEEPAPEPAPEPKVDEPAPEPKAEEPAPEAKADEPAPVAKKEASDPSTFEPSWSEPAPKPADPGKARREMEARRKAIQAIYKLGRTKGADAETKLAAIIGGTGPGYERASAVRALGRKKRSKLVPLLEKLTRSKATAVRIEASIKLYQWGEHRVALPQLKTLRAEGVALRRAFQTGYHKGKPTYDSRALAFFRAGIRSDNVYVRLDSAVGLIELKKPSEGLSIVRRVLEQEPKYHIRMAAVNYLTPLKTKASVRALLKLAVNDKDEAVAKRARDVLGVK